MENIAPAVMNGIKKLQILLKNNFAKLIIVAEKINGIKI